MIVIMQRYKIYRIIARTIWGLREIKEIREFREGLRAIGWGLREFKEFKEFKERLARL